MNVTITVQQQQEKRTFSRKKERYIQDIMVNLHNKFIAKNLARCISYSFFCKRKPFCIIELKLQKSLGVLAKVLSARLQKY